MVPLQMLLQCKQGSDRVSNLQNTISGDATARQAKKEYYLLRNNQCAVSDGVMVLANIMKQLPNRRK